MIKRDRKEIEKDVRDIASQVLGVDPREVNVDTRFVEDLQADSLDAVELLIAFEDWFDISIPDEDLYGGLDGEPLSIGTVGQAIDYFDHRLNGAPMNPHAK